VVQVGGRATHVLVTGRGAAVLLLHGNGGLGEEILAAFGPRAEVMWIAPDRPGYGFSAPLAGGRADPVAQAGWAMDLLDTLEVEAVHVVAHSIAAGLALCMASGWPERVLSLTLINPFCRPTPHRWKPGLRLAVAPVVGRVVRPVIPRLLDAGRGRVLARMAAPNRTPVTLARVPLRHAAGGRAVLSIAAELRSFNAGMCSADPRVGPRVPVVALLGADDRTAKPDWHGPWLRARVANLRITAVRGIGHMLHHVRPDLAWAAVRTAIDAGGRAPQRMGVAAAGRGWENTTALEGAGV
jgi:pimeloyl-ACP methyl ester carboxylesterase